MVGIYCKIDWYTAMFKDVSVNNVLRWIGLDPALYEDDFLQHMFERVAGYDEHVTFSVYGISVDIRKYYLLNDDQDPDNVNVLFFNKVIPVIRLDLSGSGLDYLRANEYADNPSRLDDLLQDPLCRLEGQHITRCDYAFDLINYKSDFLDKCIVWCEANQTPSGGIAISGKSRPHRVSIRKGDQKTLYLGATSAEKMLRIYDKKLQYIDRATGVYKKDNPYDNPDSWIRIELQTRSRFANSFIVEYAGDLMARFRFIYDNYAFAHTADRYYGKKDVAPFWATLFDWSAIPALLKRFDQNIHFDHVKTPAEKAADHMATNMQGVILWKLHLESNGSSIERKIDDYLCYLQHHKEDPVCHRKLTALLCKLSASGFDVSGLRFGDFNLYIEENNELRCRY